MTNSRAPNREPVLVMDDDDLVRWSVAEGLKAHGYPVVLAASAREALQGCRGAAVALLDYRLPGVDGLALADALRRSCPRCAVVLMTADPTPELRRRARQRGVARVLGKPSSLEMLVAAVRETLERSRGSPSLRPGPPAEPEIDDGP